jgi:hypothetical protein
MSLFRSVYLTTWYPSCVGTTCSSARVRARDDGISVRRSVAGRRSPFAVRDPARARWGRARDPHARPTDRPTDGRRSTIDDRRTSRVSRAPPTTQRHAAVRDGTRRYVFDTRRRDDARRRRETTRDDATRRVPVRRASFARLTSPKIRDARVGLARQSERGRTGFPFADEV